jgi:hypothetical protein
MQWAAFATSNVQSCLTVSRDIFRARKCVFLSHAVTASGKKTLLRAAALNDSKVSRPSVRFWRQSTSLRHSALLM